MRLRMLRELLSLITDARAGIWSGDGAAMHSLADFDGDCADEANPDDWPDR